MDESKDFIKELDELNLDFDPKNLELDLDDFNDIDLDLDLNKLDAIDLKLDDLDLDFEKTLEEIKTFSVDDLEPIDFNLDEL